MDRRRILMGVNSAGGSTVPMFFEALEDGLRVIFSNDIQYSVDECSTWNTLNAEATSPVVNSGNRIYFKGTIPLSLYEGIGTFTCNKACSVNGNIMSLLFADNFYEQYDLSENEYAFYKLFKGNSYIRYADKLILPATTLSRYCYSDMFRGCTSLTTAPVLPATTLAQSCYENMFRSCTSLTTAPKLPATSLGYYCYIFMFYDCTSLTTAPELPAITLVDYCYREMFYGCSKLNYIKSMFVTTPSSLYTGNWVYGVASTGTFVKNKNATWSVTGSDGIPSGWTVETA